MYSTQPPQSYTVVFVWFSRAKSVEPPSTSSSFSVAAAVGAFIARMRASVLGNRSRVLHTLPSRRRCRRHSDRAHTAHSTHKIANLHKPHSHQKQQQQHHHKHHQLSGIISVYRFHIHERVCSLTQPIQSNRHHVREPTIAVRLCAILAIRSVFAERLHSRSNGI